MHFVWPKLQNIFFYEVLNFRPASISFKTAKIANIGGAIENKHLAQEARFFLFNIQIHHSRFPSHITVPNYLFILTARIFFLARVVKNLFSKHENSSSLRAVLKSAAPVWNLLSVLMQTRNDSKTWKRIKLLCPLRFATWPPFEFPEISKTWQLTNTGFVDLLVKSNFTWWLYGSVLSSLSFKGFLLIIWSYIGRWFHVFTCFVAGYLVYNITISSSLQGLCSPSPREL